MKEAWENEMWGVCTGLVALEIDGEELIEEGEILLDEIPQTKIDEIKELAPTPKDGNEEARSLTEEEQRKFLEIFGSPVRQKGEEKRSPQEDRFPTCYYPIKPTGQNQHEHYEKCIHWGRRGDNWKLWKDSHGNVAKCAEDPNHSMVNWSEASREEWKENFSEEKQDPIATKATSSQIPPRLPIRLPLGTMTQERL